MNRRRPIHGRRDLGCLDRTNVALRALRPVGAALILGAASAQRHAAFTSGVTEPGRSRGRNLVQGRAGRTRQLSDGRATVVDETPKLRVSRDVVLCSREAAAGVDADPG